MNAPSLARLDVKTFKPLPVVPVAQHLPHVNKLSIDIKGAVIWPGMPYAKDVSAYLAPARAGATLRIAMREMSVTRAMVNHTSLFQRSHTCSSLKNVEFQRGDLIYILPDPAYLEENDDEDTSTTRTELSTEELWIAQIADCCVFQSTDPKMQAEEDLRAAVEAVVNEPLDITGPESLRAAIHAKVVQRNQGGSFRGKWAEGRTEWDTPRRPAVVAAFDNRVREMQKMMQTRGNWWTSFSLRVEQICRYERDIYVSEGSLQTQRFSNAIELLRKAARGHDNDEVGTLDASLILVVFALVQACADTDLTVHMMQTHMALVRLRTDAPCQGIDPEVDASRALLEKSCILALEGGFTAVAMAVAFMRQNVLEASSLKNTLGVHNAWVLLSAGRTCEKCGVVHPADFEQKTDKDGTTYWQWKYHPTVCNWEALTASEDQKDEFNSHQTMPCMRICFKWLPHRQLVGLFHITSRLTCKRAKHLGKDVIFMSELRDLEVAGAYDRRMAKVATQMQDEVTRWKQTQGHSKKTTRTRRSKH